MANYGFIHFSHVICEENHFLYMRKEYGFRTLITAEILEVSCDRENFNKKIVIPKENGYYKLINDGFSKIENPFTKFPERELTAGPGEEFYLLVEWEEPTPIPYVDPDEAHGFFNRGPYSIND